MKGNPLGIEFEIEPICEGKPGADPAEMDEEQRNNDTENDESHHIGSEGSPSSETLCVVEASPASDAPSVDASKDYAVSPMKEVSWTSELESCHSGLAALDLEASHTDDEFSAATEAARDAHMGNNLTGSSDPENTTSASPEHVHGELVIQQDPFKSFIEAVREYDRLYNCYKSLKDVLERDIDMFEKLKEKMDEAERNNDEEGLKVLVQETKEKFLEVDRYTPIRKAFVALHGELNKLKRRIEGDRN